MDGPQPFLRAASACGFPTPMLPPRTVTGPHRLRSDPTEHQQRLPGCVRRNRIARHPPPSHRRTRPAGHPHPTPSHHTPAQPLQPTQPRDPAKHPAPLLLQPHQPLPGHGKRGAGPRCSHPPAIAHTRQPRLARSLSATTPVDQRRPCLSACTPPPPVSAAAQGVRLPACDGARPSVCLAANGHARHCSCLPLPADGHTRR